MVENCTLWMRKEVSNLKKGLRIGDLFCTPPWIVGDSPTIHPKITPAIEMLIGDSLIANFLLSLIHMLDTTLGRAKENARKQIPPQGVAVFRLPGWWREIWPTSGSEDKQAIRRGFTRTPQQNRTKEQWSTPVVDSPMELVKLAGYT